MLFWRASQWYFITSRSFTRAAFEAKKWPPEDLELPLQSRKFVITGANAGIGYAAALAFARRGGEVHMICRSKERGEAALKAIVNETNNDNLHLHIADMQNMKQVINVVDELPLEVNVLVNNAGSMLHERVITDLGHDANFACNVLSPFVLTHKMLPRLRASGEGRVVNVSSAGMLTKKLNPDDLQDFKMKKYDGTLVYAHNKRALVYLTHKFSESEKDISFFSMHPGWAETNSVKIAMPKFYQANRKILRTPDQGADTIVWLSSSLSMESETKRQSYRGKFIFDREIASEHLFLGATTSTPKDIEKLWQYCHATYNRIIS